jgi:hypothetical protein
MTDDQEQLLRTIEARACRRAGILVRAFAQTPPQTERAAMEAELEFQRWLAASCAECLDHP